jgi:prepilin-type N-terminal cleavage/methylation domain-containing protein
MSKIFKHKNEGFTLIELLVVIAIIGILSSVVLASLNTARGKGSDAAAKSNLNNIRAQAEIVYDNTGGYATVCTDSNVTRAVTSAATNEGFTWTSTANNSTSVACTNATGTWAAWVNLAKGVGGTNYWCVDNTGTSIQKTVAPSAATATTCNGSSASAAW